MIISKIRKYKLIIKKKKQDERVLLAKIAQKLNCTKGLIFKSLITCMHDNFLLVDDAFRKYDYMKEEVNNLKSS